MTRLLEEFDNLTLLHGTLAAMIIDLITADGEQAFGGAKLTDSSRIISASTMYSAEGYREEMSTSASDEFPDSNRVSAYDLENRNCGRKKRMQCRQVGASKNNARVKISRTFVTVAPFLQTCPFSFDDVRIDKGIPLTGHLWF